MKWKILFCTSKPSTIPDPCGCPLDVTKDNCYKHLYWLALYSPIVTVVDRIHIKFMNIKFCKWRVNSPSETSSLLCLKIRLLKRCCYVCFSMLKVLYQEYLQSLRANFGFYCSSSGVGFPLSPSLSHLKYIVICLLI